MDKIKSSTKISLDELDGLDQLDNETIDNSQENIHFENEENFTDEVKAEINDILENNKKEKYDIKDSSINKEEVIKSKSFIKKTMEFIKSNSYAKLCKEYANKFKIPEKKVSSKLAGKILGAIGDGLGFVIDCIDASVSLVVQILSCILTKGATIICNVARCIAGVLTFNKTLKAVK